ncbi:hypothetical protein EDD27_7895 [Nonomuraea polychroma]|uniref:Uncharacterized protein n=1 Tax=Nonomuraea polychroma TaxID=46176 RepID=A0A438MHS4_9ACTN|nr:WHG domain-containing protein [Nonomuraea polychroma]RVX45118.1 hypothetical protein EDD27_7895 [Nonomuraea polychroma]
MDRRGDLLPDVLGQGRQIGSSRGAAGGAGDDGDLGIAVDASTRLDTLHLVVLGWAAVHGLAVLWRDGPLADQNEGADPYELSRAVLGTLAAALQARPS